MKLVKLYRVPQGAQVILQDLGQLGIRKSPNNLDQKALVDIELPGPPGGKSRTTQIYGSYDVFVDEDTKLLTK